MQETSEVQQRAAPRSSSKMGKGINKRRRLKLAEKANESNLLKASFGKALAFASLPDAPKDKDLVERMPASLKRMVALQVRRCWRGRRWPRRHRVVHAHHSLRCSCLRAADRGRQAGGQEGSAAGAAQLRHGGGRARGGAAGRRSSTRTAAAATPTAATAAACARGTAAGPQGK